MSRYSHLSLKSPLLNNIKPLKLFKCRKQFTFKALSFRLNTRSYSRLDKEVTDFIECKEEPAVLHTTKCFHHQNGEDTDNNKNCKTHTQHQKQIKHYRTITCLLVYTQHKKKNWQPVGDAITTHTNFFFAQQEHNGIVSPNYQIVVTTYACLIDVDERGIKNQKKRIILKQKPAHLLLITWRCRISLKTKIIKKGIMLQIS